MPKKKNSIILFVLLFVWSLPLVCQFRSDLLSGPIDPAIAAEIMYGRGMILFNFNMGENHHITDIKNGFFTIEIEKNDFAAIAAVVFPEGAPYADEKVFRDKFSVKVFVKTLQEITKPVALKFKVSYQICQEQPMEVCFPPRSQDISLEVNRSFNKTGSGTQKTAAEQAGSGETTAGQVPKTGEVIAAGVSPVERTAAAASPAPATRVNRLLLPIIGIILLVAVIFAGIFKPLEEGETRGKIVKAALLVIFLLGAFLYIKFLDSVPAAAEQRRKPENPAQLNWLHSIAEGKAAAQKENKKIMIDTYADWCVACKELEEYTFSDPAAAKVLDDYILVKVDFTKQDEANEKLRRELKVFGMPTVILLDAAGKELRRFSGFYNKERFLDFMGSGSGFFEKLLAPLNRELAKKSLLLFILVFGLGFLTSLTPCVYPVIPIVMGYIGARSGKKKLKGLYLSLFFVLGLALVYSILGVIAALTGTMMGVSFQNPVVVILIAVIFVVMGLSLAGLFEIPVPTSISSRMQAGHKSEVIGSLLVGGVSGIIAAPCVGPVLIALLSWISQTKDVVFGFLLTFTFSLGMGIIFFVVGTFSGLVMSLPKGGGWMEHIKHFFAVILIAGGIFIMNPILSRWLTMFIWGIFLVALSVFSGLLKPLETRKIKSKIYKSIVVIIFLTGAFLFLESLENRYFSSAGKTASTIETGWLKPAAPGGR